MAYTGTDLNKAERGWVKSRSAVNVLDYGAVGDGVTDDTSDINTVLALGGDITFPSGTYLVDAETHLTIVSNSNIYFQNGAKLKIKPNAVTTYSGVNISGVDNVNIYNLEIEGERDDHTGSTGEWGHGLTIDSGSTNIYIQNLKVSDCWGDGVYVNDVNNLVIDNAYCDNNRRQGISLISGENIAINNPICKNTNGTAPGAGIDIEPNSADEVLKNITITNPKTYNNAHAGILIFLGAMINGTSTVSIKITNHIDEGSLYGFCVASILGGTGTLSGEIYSENPSYSLNGSNGVYIYNWAYDKSPKIIIDKPSILNPNADTLTTRLGAGISIYKGNFSGSMGNIHIKNPSIKDIRSSALMTYAFYIIDDHADEFVDVILEDPINLTGAYYTTVKSAWGLIFSDKFKQTKITLAGTSYTIYDYSYSEMENTGAVALATINLAKTKDSATPTTFVVNNANGIKIIPKATENILPLSATVGKYITSTELGASITIQKVSDTQWTVLNQIGTWSVEP